MLLPRIVAARLQGRPLPEHPDPDLLTAFAEHTLLGKEREQVLGHLADCAECRQVIALAAPEQTPEALTTPLPGKTSWLRAPVLRWGALAASVIVVATAVLMYKGEQPARSDNAELAMKQRPAPATPAIVPPQEHKQLAQLQPPAAQARTRKAPLPLMKTIPQGYLSADAERSALGAAPAPPNPSTADMTQPSAPPSTETNTETNMQIIAPPVTGGTVNTKQATETVEVQGASPAIPSESGIQLSQQAPLKTRNSMEAAKAAPAFTPRPTTETAASTMGGAAKFTDFRPPSWRLSEDGLPERSFSSGQWEKIQVDHKKGFHALASQGMEVWVGGPAGLLYHSEDVGLNWTRIIPVTGNATLADDVTSITFADHFHGQVKTATGKTWVTSDAGKTWETH